MRTLDRLLVRRRGLPPATHPRVTIHRDLAVPLRDGVVLKADRYVPERGGSAPLVLLRSPYGRAGLLSAGLFAVPLAMRGLQALVVSTRGTAGSGGELDPFLERDDGLDVVAWLRAQRWYPGRFATAGPSYLGLTQWAVADAAPGELVAMVPLATASQFAGHTYPGGAFSLESALYWSLGMALAGPRGPRVLRTALAAPRLRGALHRVPLRSLDRLATGRRLPFWQAWVDHTDPDHPYWRARDHRAQVRATTAQVTLVAGWDDIFLPWQLEDHAALVAAGRAPRLVLGPWNHGDASAQVGEVVASLLAAFDLGPAPAGGPVRVFVTGAGGGWRDLPAWPPAGAVTTPWQVTGPTGPPARFRYDPSDPTPNLGGPRLAPGRARVRQERLMARADVVTFTGPVLERPLEVAGPVTATLSVRSSVDDAQLFVRLCEVDARGRTWHVSDGIRRVDPAAAQVAVGLWPIAHRFAAGHRLRLLVAGGAHPRYARSFGTGEPIADATWGRPAELEVLHPSRVDLPVVQ